MLRWYEQDRDLDFLAMIDAKSSENYWTPDDFKNVLRQKAVTCLIAEEDSRTVGFLIYEIFMRRFSILRMAILPSYRRRGIGRSLVKRLTERLTEARPLVSAEVRESNLPAQLFLSSSGFSGVEVMRDYYPDTHEDAYVMHYRFSKNREKFS